MVRGSRGSPVKVEDEATSQDAALLGAKIRVPKAPTDIEHVRAVILKTFTYRGDAPIDLVAHSLGALKR